MYDGQGDAMKTRRPSFVEVDLGAIADNTRELKKMIGDERLLMAVVKADAYGHGVVPVCERALSCGADWLGVALPQEALALREAGVTAPILVVGYSDPDAYRLLIGAGIRMTVYSFAQGMAMAAAAREEGAKAIVHFKIDTGMGRIGFLPGDEALSEIKALADAPELAHEGCFTHFARADDIDDTSWRAQLSVFNQFLDRLAGLGVNFTLTHCANTAAGMRDPSAIMDMYRAGIGIYGIYPSAEVKTWSAASLRPALSWKSVLSHVKWVKKGDGVSYGHIWKADRDTLVGTVPVGYADGYNRAFERKAYILVRGKRAPVIGRICMDMFMVDLTDAPEAKAADEVVLLGRQGDEEISADMLADMTGTISYEIICSIGSRIPRHYIN